MATSTLLRALPRSGATTASVRSLHTSAVRAAYGGSSYGGNSSGGSYNSFPRRNNNNDGYNSSSQSPSSFSSPSQRAQAPISPRAIDTAPPAHLLTLADLSVGQLTALLQQSLALKLVGKHFSPQAARQTLAGKTVAMMFSKRSTRTRVASESATQTLGGHPMFLGSQDIQLGVNESLRDTAQVVGSMVHGIMARVGQHAEVEELAAHSPVPVINALSHLWHPTQILADLLTLHETYMTPIDLLHPQREFRRGRVHSDVVRIVNAESDPLASLKGKKVAWVGDMNNVSWELMATLPRMGMEMSVAAPAGYDQVDDAVMARLKEHGIDQRIKLTNSPKEALYNADVVVTDTWISMGQEDEKEARLKAFAGYQVTNEMVESAGAKADWKFMHCLPRKAEEVDDEVFYGERSLVFPEAENRKWTIMACFDALFGSGRLREYTKREE